MRARSTLGRPAKPSQHLLLALEYLRLAPACITLLKQREREPLTAIVEQGLLRRREQLPALIFDAAVGNGSRRAASCRFSSKDMAPYLPSRVLSRSLPVPHHTPSAGGLGRQGASGYRQLVQCR